MVYPYNGILFNHEKNEVLTHATMWVNLQNIMLSEISHKQKEKYQWFHWHEVSRIGEFIQTERDWGRGNGKLVLNGHRVSIWGDKSFGNKKSGFGYKTVWM